jgi:hypothetical protein
MGSQIKDEMHRKLGGWLPQIQMIDQNSWERYQMVLKNGY